MNFYGEYADIPSIPSDILLSKEQILALPESHYHSEMKAHRGEYEGVHKLKKVNPELKEWLKENFPFDIVAYYSIYPILIAPHVDIRSVGYNYYIDTGGEIDTVFYNKVSKKGQSTLWNSINPSNKKYDTLNDEAPLTELARIKFEPNRWIKLQTNIPHGTDGDLIGPRIFITVTQIDDWPIKDSPIAKSLQYMIDNW